MPRPLRRPPRRARRRARVADRPRPRPRPGAGLAGGARRGAGRRATPPSARRRSSSRTARRSSPPPGPACVAVKPQVACFERLGAPGLGGARARRRARRARPACSSSPTPSAATSASPPRPTRRRSSAARPRRSAASPGVDADAMTVNPYLGADTLEPFVADRPRRLRPRAHVATPAPPTSRTATLDDGDARCGSASRGIVDRPRRRTPSSARPRPSTSRGRASSCRARRSCCPASARRAAASRTSRPRSRPAAHGGLVTASRSIARAHEQHGGEPAAAARAEAERLREQAWALGVSALQSAPRCRPAAMPPARAGSAPLALLAALAGGLRDRRTRDDGRRRARRQRPADVGATPTRGAPRRRSDGRRDGDDGAATTPTTDDRAAQDLHGPAGRHARPRSPRGPASPVEELQELNPDVDSNSLTVGAEDQARASERAAPHRSRPWRRSLVAAALAGRPRPPRRSSRPTSARRAAIVVEASTGDVVVRQRNADERARDRLDDEAHDRAARARERRARRRAHRAAPTTPAPVESVVGLRAGRADDRPRPAARAAARRAPTTRR